MDSRELRLFFQKIYCKIDIFDLAKFLNIPVNDQTLKDETLLKHWQRLQGNFAEWYCELNDEDSVRFIRLVEDM